MLDFETASVITKCEGCERLVAITRDVAAISKGVMCRSCVGDGVHHVRVECDTCHVDTELVPSNLAFSYAECEDCMDARIEEDYDPWDDYACENGCCACCGCTCGYYFEVEDEEEGE